MREGQLAATHVPHNKNHGPSCQQCQGGEILLKLTLKFSIFINVYSLLPPSIIPLGVLCPVYIHLPITVHVLHPNFSPFSSTFIERNRFSTFSISYCFTSHECNQLCAGAGLHWIMRERLCTSPQFCIQCHTDSLKLALVIIFLLQKLTNSYKLGLSPSGASTPELTLSACFHSHTAWGRRNECRRIVILGEPKCACCASFSSRSLFCLISRQMFVKPYFHHISSIIFSDFGV